MTLEELVTWCKAQPRHAFCKMQDGSILFEPCGVRSWNPNDVERRYCGRCHRFMDEVVDLENADE
jgi:hypothetical protein